MRSLLLLVVLFIAPPVKPLTIKVDKTVFFAGQDITVTCLVPRHEDNRKVEALLIGYSSSEHQLDGAASAITHRFTFSHVPADVTTAACQLTDRYGKFVHVIQPLQVSAP